MRWVVTVINRFICNLSIVQLEIKKMGEVLQETLMMIPDCHRRLVAALSDLSNVLETEADLNVDGELEEFVVAAATIKEAEEYMKVE